MKIIYNKYLPTKGFSAINLFGILFARSEFNPLSEKTINHEKIHTRQMKEMLYIFFYLWYGIEWIIRLIQYRNSMSAYYNISFEREAYRNERDPQYLDKRKMFSSMRYLKESFL